AGRGITADPPFSPAGPAGSAPFSGSPPSAAAAGSGEPGSPTQSRGSFPMDLRFLIKRSPGIVGSPPRRAGLLPPEGRSAPPPSPARGAPGTGSGNPPRPGARPRTA